jgi:hypothetical protein
MGFRAEEVKPERWDNIEVLFDNGWYSVISGVYEPSGKNSPAVASQRIGERWNGGEDSPGYPNQGKYPLWYCLPAFLETPVLHGLLDELARHPDQQTPEGAMTPVDTAHERCRRILDELARIQSPAAGAAAAGAATTPVEVP